MESWLVQVPPGVDISKAKEIKDGEFQIGKSTFILTPAPVSVGKCVTLKYEDGKYTQAAGPKQLMELTKTVALPKIDKSVKQPKSLVPQRLNLKTRHFATGYGPSSGTSSSLTESVQKRHIDEAAAEPTPKKRKTSSSSEPKTPKSVKKKKSKGEKTPTSNKKEKKSKLSKEEKKKKSKLE